jgi:hypothetical protein
MPVAKVCAACRLIANTSSEVGRDMVCNRRNERNLGWYRVALLEMLCCQDIAAIIENSIVRFGAVLVAVDVYEGDVQIQGCGGCKNAHFDVCF